MSESITNSMGDFSPSGNPILRHGEPTAWQHAVGEQFLEDISNHIATHLGPISSVFHEIVSDTVHIDVHIVPPNDRCPFMRLVTSGMSDLPMTTPDDPDIPKYVELMMTLPGDWRVDQASCDDENWYWPTDNLKYLARLPHKCQTWLGWGHTIPNGNPMVPYAPNTKLCGAIILPSVTVPDEFHQLDIPDQKRITFYAVVPLYEGEMNLKLQLGSDELLKRFGRKHITDAVDLNRKDVSRKLFGIW